MGDLEQLVQASRLYYELGETQSRVAELLGVTRPQVSRLLKRARAEGIVEIRIIDRTSEASPAADESATSFRSPGGPPRAEPQRSRGRRPADDRTARCGGPAGRRSVTGRSSGSVMARRSPPLPTPSTSRPTQTGATVLPLCGGYWFSGPAREPFRRVADGIGGVPLGLLAPGLVDDPTTKASLYAHDGLRRVLDLWDRLDVAAFGIGGPAWSEATFGAATCRESSPEPRWANCSSPPSTSTVASSPTISGREPSPSTRATCRRSPSGSVWPVARPRSGRSSARCGPAASRRS